jgi:hypothetical protein
MANETDPVTDAIEAYVKNAFDAYPICWENDNTFRQPEPPAPWVKFEIAGTLYAQETIGAGDQADNRWDEEGTIWWHVMVPAGTRGSRARGIAKTLANLFRGKTLLSGSLEFLEAQVGTGEPGNETGSYWRVSVSIDWRRMDAD